MEQSKILKEIRVSADYVLSLSDCADNISELCSTVVACLKSGNKVLTAGNGGSAAEALHMSEELIGRFRGNRVSLPSVCLCADCTALTCIGNDFGFDFIFSRQVEGLGKPGDLLVLFSTSGNANNLKKALEAARMRQMKCATILGRDGGNLAGLADVEIVVKGDLTEKIQEAHQVILHIVLEAVEAAFSAAK